MGNMDKQKVLAHIDHKHKEGKKLGTKGVLRAWVKWTNGQVGFKSQQ